METTNLLGFYCKGYIGIMEKKMETVLQAVGHTVDQGILTSISGASSSQLHL